MRGVHIDIRPWLKRLNPGRSFGAVERRALEDVLSSPQRFSPHEVLVRQGESSDYAVLALAGLMARAKETKGGARQIVSILTPGDICSCGLALSQPGDFALVALSHGKCARITAGDLRRLQTDHPALMLPIARSLVEENVITREWVANTGARVGRARIAHLLCELAWRLSAVGLASDDECTLPLMQQDTAAAVGLSVVQTNRVLQRLQMAGLIALGRGGLDVLDVAGLKEVAGFDSHYLEVRDHGADSLIWRSIELH